MAHATEAPREETGLRRGSLTIWEAIGLSIALMAPSMAAKASTAASFIRSTKR